jgi:hypothetical protein
MVDRKAERSDDSMAVPMVETMVGQMVGWMDGK